MSILGAVSETASKSLGNSAKMSSEAPEPTASGRKDKTMANHEDGLTWNQALEVLRLAKSKGISREQMTKLLSSGLLSDLLDANVDIETVNRRDLQKVIGLLKNMEVWKTVRLGTHRSHRDYKGGVDFRHSGILEMEKHIRLSDVEVELDLVVVTTEELGFTKSLGRSFDDDLRASREDIYDRALHLGLKLCPPEAAYALNEITPRLYGDSADYCIAMEPVCDAILRLGRVPLTCDGHLTSGPGGENVLWRAKDKWVFVLPRKVNK